jgi:hypothetical protein
VKGDFNESAHVSQLGLFGSELMCLSSTNARTTDSRCAHEMLALIGKLYDVEREAKQNELNASAIKELRQLHSKPILDAIRARLNDWSVEFLPKSPIGQAVSYARAQWEALNRYLDDGDLDIDNNLAERVLRTVCACQAPTGPPRASPYPLE